MTPGRLDLEVPRNGSDARVLQLFTHDEDGNDVRIDITGYSFSAKARDIFGGAVIATAIVAIDTADQGKVSMKWVGAQFDSFGDQMATCVAAYDLKMIDTSGTPTVPVRGLLYISPEATA